MRILLLILAVFTIAATPVRGDAPPIPADKAVIRFETSFGVVTFNHQKHAGLSFTTCTTCHHTYQAEAGGPVQPCHACHAHDSGGAGTTAARLAFHDRCTGCHEYTASRGESAGPLETKCLLCHIE